MSNLQQRIITAVVLLALFIPALLVSTPWPFLLLTLLLIGAGAWEWSRLIGWSGWRAWMSGALCVVICAIQMMPMLMLDGLLHDQFGAVLYGLSLPLWLRAVSVGMATLIFIVYLLWIIGVPWLLWRGVARWPAVPRWLRWSIGMAMLCVAWGALAQAYAAERVGFLLSVLVLVWAADIGGYVFGRALGGKLTGGRKLAPAISPGKTWEGALGGFICVLLVGVIWVWFDSSRDQGQLQHVLIGSAWVYAPKFLSLYTILWRTNPVIFLLGLAFLTAMSVVGDLFESLVKRAAGVKDSSQLLPGHGGVLDRIDALLPTLPLAEFIIALPLVAPVMGN